MSLMELVHSTVRRMQMMMTSGWPAGTIHVGLHLGSDVLIVHACGCAHSSWVTHGEMMIAEDNDDERMTEV
jgi:hypothetical protein